MNNKNIWSLLLIGILIIPLFQRLHISNNITHQDQLWEQHIELSQKEADLQEAENEAFDENEEVLAAISRTEERVSELKEEQSKRQSELEDSRNELKALKDLALGKSYPTIEVITEMLDKHLLDKEDYKVDKIKDGVYKFSHKTEAHTYTVISDGLSLIVYEEADYFSDIQAVVMTIGSETYQTLTLDLSLESGD